MTVVVPVGLLAAAALIWVWYWTRRSKEERQRLAVEDARRRYEAALTRFAAAREALEAVRRGEDADFEQRRRDNAVAAGRAYYEFSAAGGVPIPYDSYEDDRTRVGRHVHIDLFTYGPHMHGYRDSFVEADLERVAAGLAPAMSWRLTEPNEASRRFLAELEKNRPPRVEREAPQPPLRAKD